MKFEDWYEVNPWKDRLEALNLSEKEKKKLTPVIVHTAFIIDTKPFYEQFTHKYKKAFTPEFSLRLFSLKTKQKHIAVVPYYYLEKELNFLISKVPEAVKLEWTLAKVDKFLYTLADGEFFETTLEKGYDERVKILKDGKLYGYKYKEVRQ